MTEKEKCGNKEDEQKGRRREASNYNQNAVFKERNSIIVAMLKIGVAVSMII